MQAEADQREHYNRIGAEYEAQYGDPDGLTYRERFLYEPLLAGLDLEGRHVLEALSGSGHATEYLLEQKKALVTGLDISDEAIASFKERWPTCDAFCASITESGLPDESFDCIVVVMGLHHLHPHLLEALREVHRLLRKGGTFCFTEPHKESAFRVPLWLKRIYSPAIVRLETMLASFHSRTFSLAVICQWEKK